MTANFKIKEKANIKQTWNLLNEIINKRKTTVDKKCQY